MSQVAPSSLSAEDLSTTVGPAPPPNPFQLPPNFSLPALPPALIPVGNGQYLDLGMTAANFMNDVGGQVGRAGAAFFAAVGDLVTARLDFPRARAAWAGGVAPVMEPSHPIPPVAELPPVQYRTSSPPVAWERREDSSGVSWR